MTRLHAGSSNRSRSASTRSASTTPRSNASNWPRTLLDSQGSPSNDGEHISTSPSEGSRRVFLSDGDHSPSQGNENEAEGDGWHEAFHQTDNVADVTEESGINDDHRLEIQFNCSGQPIKDTS
ncbi:hypothetical protein MKX01_040935 [Papaver californicum]|nr:hypothetical protein MKX01_040935 [Papaver californicum]